MTSKIPDSCFHRNDYYGPLNEHVIPVKLVLNLSGKRESREGFIFRKYGSSGFFMSVSPFLYPPLSPLKLRGDEGGLREL
jgi:hypothetical protein